MKTILLKYEKSNCLIWIGLNKKEKNINEEPLILNFDNQEYYFYLSNIMKSKNNWNTKWINFRNQIDYCDQEKIIDKFSKITDKKNFDHQIILLELKYKILENFYKPLNNNIEIIKNFLQEKNPKNEIINDEINFLDKKNIYFKIEFKILIKNIKELDNKNNNIEKKIIHFTNELDNFSKKWSELSENLENLRKKLQKKEDFLKIEKKYIEILNNKKIKEKRLNNNNKAIFLSRSNNKSLVWIGTNEKPETVNDEILTLSFDNQKFYFYPKNIRTYSYNWNKKWINFKIQLNYTDQEKIINSFDKASDKTDLYHQIILFRIKIEFFLNEFKILSENLKYEQDKNIILIMQKEELGNKINLLYKKILYFNKKSYLYDYFNKELIQQIINDIKTNEQDNEIEIHPNFNETNTKKQTWKQKTIILNQKIDELNKNLNFHISIFEKLNNYKYDEILIESEIKFNDHIKSEDQNLEENEDNTDKPSTSFNSSNNQTIIKQESPENYEPLLKKIKIENLDSTDFDLEQNELTF